VNQAFRRGWHARDGRQPFSKGGLLALPVHGPRDRIELSYRPASFVAGTILSLATLFAACGWAWTKRRGRPA
jgi:uncharacterized membrane protein YfhO